MYFVLCSSLVTLFLTLFQLQRDYHSDIAERDESIEQIKQVHLETISEGLWATDTEILHTILDGLINIRDVEYVAIVENEKLLLSVGDEPDKQSVTKSFPLNYKYLGNIEEIGHLEVIIDQDAAFRRILDRALVILISNAIKTTLVIIFALIIFHLMVTRHLSRIIEYLSEMDPTATHKPLVLKRYKPNTKTCDELDMVVDTINQSSTRLIDTLAMKQEIKEREISESLARKSETRLLKILDNSPFGVSILSLANRKRLYFNRRFTEMLGIDPQTSDMEEAVRSSYTSPTAREELWEKFLRYGEINSVERQRVRPDGTIWWAYSDWRPYSFAGQDAVMIWLSDITEQKEAETKLSQLNDQKNKFFSIIAHDLKGPFNALLGFSSLLAKKGTSLSPEKTVQYGEAVHKSAEQVFKLLENLLDWSLIQMDRMEVELAPVEIQSLIQDNLELFEAIAEEKAIELSSQCNGCPTVNADIYMVNTIIRNLVHNAIKFTPAEGKVTINCKEKPPYAVVEITDTGVGMSASKLKKLFQLAEKSSTLGTSGEKGTGLGLPLCMDLVGRQGGEISVTSIKGKGSTFMVKLPLLSKNK